MERKTRDEYWIMGNYGYGWEFICSEDSHKDAMRTYRDYLENERDIGAFKVIKKRVKVEPRA